MIFFTLLAIMFLFNNYVHLAYLLNPGFVSIYDHFFMRQPFWNSGYLSEYLERDHIRTGLFGDVTTEVEGISFTYAPFWVGVDRWLMAILLIAMILLVINRVLVLMKKLPEYIADIPVYAMVILSVGGYYLSVKVLGGYAPEKGIFHGTMLALVILSIVVIAYAVFRKTSDYRWNKNYEKHKKKHLLKKVKDYSSDDLEDYIIKDESEKKEEKKKDEDKKPKDKMTFARIVIIAQVLLILILPCKFMIDAIKVSLEYKPNYGMFKPGSMKVRKDLEYSGFAGNLANQAVDTEEGLYFIEYETRPLEDGEDAGHLRTRSVYLDHHHTDTIVELPYIRKLDEEGNITDVCPAKGDDKEINFDIINIGYADGYLYTSTQYFISRIDPKDGSEIEVISAPIDYYIAEMCVVDNKLYYMLHPEDYQSVEKSYVWVCEIDGTKLSDPELYASDLNREEFFAFYPYGSSTLFTNLVNGDFIEYYYNFYGRYQKCDGKEFFILEGSHWKDKYTATSLIIKDESDPQYTNFIEKVGGFNLYKNSIYFVKLKENGFDVCKCNLDGANVKVLDTYTCNSDLTKNEDQAAYRVMIGQGKIYVSANGDIYPMEIGVDKSFGTLTFVTDLD